MFLPVIIHSQISVLLLSSIWNRVRYQLVSLEEIPILDTTLFVIELLRIGVCRFLSIVGAVSLRKEELISAEFVLCNWLCEWSYCILSISFVGS